MGKDPLPAEWSKAFDVATSSGCLLYSHFPSCCFEEKVKCLKKGGHMIFTMRDLYFAAGKEQGYFEALEKLEAEGTIAKVKRH